MIEQEDRQAETSDLPSGMPSEINIFSLDPHGFKTHWKIIAGTTAGELNELIKRQGTLSNWLAAHQFEPDDFGRGYSRTAPASNGAKAAEETPADPDAPTCAECGGRMEYKTGKSGPKSKNPGRPWQGYFCVADKRHAAQFI